MKITITPGAKRAARALGAQMAKDVTERALRRVLAANDRQEGGDHYRKKAIQPWDFIVANDIGFLAGNAIKYLTRYKDKNGIEDLRKARHYLDKLIEVEEANAR